MNQGVRSLYRNYYLKLIKSFKSKTIQGIRLSLRSYYSNLMRSFKHNTIQGIRLLHRSCYVGLVFMHVSTEYTLIDSKHSYFISKLLIRHKLTK